MEMWFWNTLKEGHRLVWLRFPFVPLGFHFKAVVQGGGEAVVGLGKREKPSSPRLMRSSLGDL